MASVQQLMASFGGIAKDANYSSVVLLEHMNGANNSTTFTDSGPLGKTATVVSGAKVTTALSQFGNGSLVLNGTTDYLTFAASTSWDFGTGDFTVEGWIYPTSLSGNHAICGNRGASSNAEWFFYLAGTHLYFSGGTNDFIVGTYTFTTNSWYHVALSRVGTTLKSFVNGTQDISVTNSQNFTINQTLGVGCTNAGAYPFAGNLEDIRITKGVGRYTSNFTVPNAAFPNS